jgi:predicted nicotinamide N-methyase
MWKGSKVLSKWMCEKQKDLFKDKIVLELGSGIGLCGFTSSFLGAKQVVLTDYKTPIMELIAHNISHFK